MILPVPGSWEVWFPDERPKVPPDLWWHDDWVGEEATCLREMREEPQVPLWAGFVEHGPVGPGTPLSPSKELSHLIFPSTPGGRYFSLPLFWMRKLRQRAAICLSALHKSQAGKSYSLSRAHQPTTLAVMSGSLILIVVAPVFLLHGTWMI